MEMLMNISSINYKNEDLFENFTRLPGQKIIVHVVNDMGAWGAGFSRALSKKFHFAKTDYRKKMKKFFKKYDGKELLGTVLVSKVSHDIIVVHMIAQNGLPSKTNPQPLNYSALKDCMIQINDFVTKVKKDFKYANELAKNGELPVDYIEDTPISLHCPKFGAGLARGDWSKIEQFIESTWCVNAIDVNVYSLE